MILTKIPKKLFWESFTPDTIETEGFQYNPDATPCVKRGWEFDTQLHRMSPPKYPHSTPPISP